MFLPNMTEAKKVFYVYGELGKLHLGSLWTHLENEGVHPTM